VCVRGRGVGFTVSTSAAVLQKSHRSLPENRVEVEIYALGDGGTQEGRLQTLLRLSQVQASLPYHL